MKKKSAKTKSSAGFMIKVVLPTTLILIVVGFLYWGSEAVKDPNRSKHKMADGVAKFYSTFRKSFMPGATQLDEYTIQLPEEDLSVSDKLQIRGAQVRPAEPNWTGEDKRRSFKENDTLKTALTKFGNAEGVEVIWDLKYDYIIKNHFVETADFRELIEKMSKTVNNDYDGQARGYFCPQERAIVLTDKPDQYVTEFCERTTSARRLAIEKRNEKNYKLRQKLGLN
ncbi:MAG: hypothetical protein ACJAZB_000466 [Psychrosphaera sp.]|jgi:hypothetical protein